MGPASVIVGNLVQGNRLAAASGRDIGGLEDHTGDTGWKKYQFIFSRDSDMEGECYC